jgi:VCBS repeat protein/IPT/TIG domain-containing protein
MALLAIAMLAPCGTRAQLCTPGHYFRTPLSVPTQGDPIAIATADFNGDSLLDAAVANYASGTVSLLFGTGTGAFQPAVNIPAGNFPLDIAAADLDHDGAPDLVISAEQSILVLPGLVNGGHATGTFGAPRTIDLGSITRGIVVRDLNGDGIPDVAAATEAGLAVMIAHGSGGTWDGTFAPVARYPSVVIWRLAVADFDRDGALDIAASARFDNSAQLFHGVLSGSQPTGAFTGPEPVFVGAQQGNIAAGDFNRDGWPDMAVTTHQLVTLINRRDGTFEDGVYDLNDGFYGVAIGDVNNDGILDVVATGTLLTLLIGTGDGTFLPTERYTVGSAPVGVTLADLNRDEGQDALVANVASSNISVLIATCHAIVIPALVSFTPAGGAPGDSVGISGAGFGGITDVQFGGVSAPFQVIDETAIRAVVPMGATTGPISVTNSAGTATSATAFVVGAHPALTFVTPDRERVDRTVAIAGLHLTAATHVRFGEGSDAAFVVRSDSLILAVVDAGARTGPITVSTITGRTTSAFTFTLLTPDSAAEIVAVRDVPNDQGGRVFVNWMRSAADRPGSRFVTEYRVWRRVPVASPRSRDRMASDYWEPLIELPATGLIGYAYAAPTTQDSMTTGNPYTAFYVQTVTIDPLRSFASPPDSGYSVDNLAPAAPAGVTAAMGPGGVTVRWMPGIDPDLAGYRVYRSAGPGRWNRIASVTASVWTEPAPMAASDYAITAVDTHGNESTMAETRIAGPDRGEVSLSVASPCAAEMRISIRTAGSEPARLELLDVTGRRILRRAVPVSAGEQVVTIPAAALRPGMVIVRFTQGEAVATARGLVLR